jgi:hypothetical protein
VSDTSRLPGSQLGGDTSASDPVEVFRTTRGQFPDHIQRQIDAGKLSEPQALSNARVEFLAECQFRILGYEEVTIIDAIEILTRRYLRRHAPPQYVDDEQILYEIVDDVALTLDELLMEGKLLWLNTDLMPGETSDECT